MKNRGRKFRGYSPVRAAGGEAEKTKVGVERGFGPRHSANAKEGDSVDLTKVNTDSVPAMLTPREAVLNRNAAELAGRPEIEALNKKGNALASKGVDLAAEGDTDVTKPSGLNVYDDIGYMNPDEYAKWIAGQRWLMRQPDEEGRIHAPEYPDAYKLYDEFARQEKEGHAEGVNMKSKQKPARKLAGGESSVPGYGRGPAPWDSGVPSTPQDASGIPAYQQLPTPYEATNPIGMSPAPGYSPGGFSGGTPMRDVMPQPQMAGPHGKYAWRRMGSGSFYPAGASRFAEDTPEVTGIGAPNPQRAYSQEQVDFSKAPDMSGFIRALEEERKKQGLSEGQMAGIAKQFAGMGGGGGYGGGEVSPDAFWAGSGGYQGGISDIGYPPFLMPNAEYHADKGSTWEGAYDPQFLVQRYAGGRADVPEPGGFGRLGRGDFPGPSFNNPNDIFNAPDLPPVGGSNTPNLDRPFQGNNGGYNNRSSWQGGAPGMPWSPTAIPTNYDPQGYPFAVPVQGPDQNLQGVGRTHNLRKNV